MMDDVISRQAAIDAVKSRKTAEQCKEGEVRNWTVDACVDMIKKMPSAQPKRTQERTKTHTCDYINRKDAIDAHYEYCNKHPDAGFPVWSLKILEDLPSAQSEPPWILVTEQMPERNLVVLVTTKWGEVTEGVKLSGNAWFIGRGEENAFDSDILAWMPLPEAFREGEG